MQSTATRTLDTARSVLWALALLLATSSTAPAQIAPRGGQHDFDFQFGTWNVHVRRLVHPLTASAVWVTYEGTHTVRRLWNGRANVGVLEVKGPAGCIEGMQLRLYNPQTHRWSLSFASSRDGALGPPAIGGFENGRGEFVDRESYNGRTILERSVTFDITPRSYRDEGAFSADGGKTWHVNWIALYTRVTHVRNPRTAAGAAVPGRANAPPVRTTSSGRCAV